MMPDRGHGRERDRNRDGGELGGGGRELEHGGGGRELQRGRGDRGTGEHGVGGLVDLECQPDVEREFLADIEFEGGAGVGVHHRAHAESDGEARSDEAPAEEDGRRLGPGTDFRRDVGYASNSRLSPFEDWNNRLDRLMNITEKLAETNRTTLEYGTNKRMRSVVNASNSGPVNSNTNMQSVQSASSPTPVSPIQKRNKRVCSKKSLVWKYFSTGFRGQDPIATCNHCGQIYSCDQSTHGTSTLWYHLRNLCPEDPLKGQGNVRKNPGTPKHTFSVEDCRKALAEMVIIDEMPFTTTEGVGFRRYSKVLQPKFEPPSRVTVARDCMQRYIEEKPKLKKLLKNHRICLTTDTWTSKQNLRYMTLTAHWIDDQWNLQRRILNFCSVEDHKGETLGKRVEECLLESGIDCIFTITVDNASSNDRMISYLMGVCKDWNGVVLEHKFLHVRCCSHIVNLVVKSGLEEHNESVDKIRTAVRFVRSSPARLKLFKKCAELEKIPTKSLLALDLETRWNSTYLMLESAEKFEKAFARLGRDHKSFRASFPNGNPPNAHDWSTGGRIVDPLRCSLSTDTVEALICTQSWLHTSHTKLNAREVAEEVQSYEDLKEEFFSKECTDSQHSHFMEV